MQRHSVPAMPSRICASVGFGFWSSSALAVMIWPFWQKPHCGTCSSIQACCSGCSLPPCRQAFERGDLGALHRRHRPDARPDRLAVDDHRARAALAEPAAEPRTLQAEIVAQDVEQRRRRIDVHRVRRAVHLQCDVGHQKFLRVASKGSRASVPGPYTASDSDEKLNSRTRSAGIIRPAVVGDGPPDVLEAVQHQQRALVPAEVLQRARDLALLDEERAVAREPGLQHRARIERADVEEVRDEDAALAARRSLCSVVLVPPASVRPPANARAGRLLALLLRPEPRVGQIPQDPFLDPDRARERQAFGVERLAEQRRVRRIGVERDPLVHHLLADARAAARLRERAAPFVRASAR